MSESVSEQNTQDKIRLTDAIVSYDTIGKHHRFTTVVGYDENGEQRCFVIKGKLVEEERSGVKKL